ncbi:Appr-1-p processing domain-containing protein [groundwater metagenome]
MRRNLLFFLRRSLFILAKIIYLKAINTKIMEASIGHARVILLQGDITEQETEAIVNAANSSLMGGGGVDGAIHRKGGAEILEECKLIRRSLPDGLPIWSGGNNGEPELLARDYRNSLALALKMGIKTISFPSISTGAYGYPVEKASRVALWAVVDFLVENAGIDEVRFVLHSRNDLRVYEEALKEIAGQ